MAPDVHPEFYGMDTGYPREGQHWPDGDRRQIELVLQCRQRGLPLLGICRGHQVIKRTLTVERSFKTWMDMKARRSWMTTVLVVIR